MLQVDNHDRSPEPGKFDGFGCSDHADDDDGRDQTLAHVPAPGRAFAADDEDDRRQRDLEP